MFIWPPKDPDEVIDYYVEWVERLEAGETLSSSTFILESGDVVLADEAIVGTKTRVWLSGGTDRTQAVITNRVTTSVGRTWDIQARIRIRTH